MQRSDDALALLHTYAWPGNTRELENLMRYIGAVESVNVVLVEHVVERSGLAAPPHAVLREVTTSPDRRFRVLADEIRELEITRIREAVDATGGNQTRATTMLAMRTSSRRPSTTALTPKR